MPSTRAAAPGSRSRAPAKASIFWIILIAFVLAMLEGLSSLHVVERARPGIVLDLFLRNYFAAMSKQYIEDFRTRAFDANLGWTNPPNSLLIGVNKIGQSYEMHYGADGSREDGLTEARPLVTTYGDSFTAGDEVNDDQSWPFVLQRLLGRDVRNFGTNAYGTDQAVLKFEQHVRSHLIAPVVVLGIMSENINRIRNDFRPFYLPGTIYKLGFKPRYRCTASGGAEAMVNPLQHFKSTAHELRAVATEAARSDPYAQSKLRLSWPFTAEMARLFYEYGMARFGKGSWLFPDRASLDLWADRDTSHLMRCILKRFVTVARAQGSAPILVFIPTAPEARTPPYQSFVAGLEETLPGTAIVDISKEPFDARRFAITPKGGHPSPYGNRIIAAAVDRAVEAVLRSGSAGHGPQ